MININRLQADRVNPRLEEVQTFQQPSRMARGTGNQTATNMDDFLSDQDEWDVLDDETLKKTINDLDGMCGIVKKFDIGDRVEAVSGQYKSIKGVVTKIVDDNYRNSFILISTLVFIKSIDKTQLTIKVWTKDLQKYFESGEKVVIISGVHSGGAGTITAIQDNHAIVAMEGTNHELKILLSNIKIKRDELDYVKLDGFIAKSKFQVPYVAGDLILYD